MRIHSLPPRRTERTIARRAASIWRLDTQAGSSAWRPNSPKSTWLPRSAIPRRRPRCTLRYLTRFGINIATTPLLGALDPRQVLALMDPHLNADASERG